MQKIKNITFTLVLYVAISFKAFAAFTPLSQFGNNPGQLTASVYIAQKNNAPTIVLLHGCVQSGEKLAQQSGLLSLAKDQKINLLVPQQSLTNNPKNCFNWYSPQDTDRDQGEVYSIKNMMLTLQTQLKGTEFYIVGLSAGGAMTSAMLFNYPELFKGGAVIAGIPFACASDVIQAISCMKNGPSKSIKALADSGLKLNKTDTKWPRLSIWTGSLDNIVNPINSDTLAKQWATIQGITEDPSVVKEKGYQLTTWQEQSIELIEIDNIGHGFPVNPTVKHGGKVAPFLLDSPLSAVAHIVRFWKI